MGAECRALTRLSGARRPGGEPSWTRAAKRVQASQDDREDGGTWTRRTATSSRTSIASTRCCADEAPRGRRAAKSSSRGRRKRAQGRTQKRTRGRRGAHRGHRLGRGRRPRHRGQGRPAHPARARHEPLDVRRASRGASPAPSTCPRPRAHGPTRALRLLPRRRPPCAARHRRRALRHGRGRPHRRPLVVPVAPRALSSCCAISSARTSCASSTSRASCRHRGAHHRRAEPPARRGRPTCSAARSSCA